MKKYICQYSGGLSSFEATRRTIEKYGKENVRVWFADTMSESPDLYRFNKDLEKIFGWNIEIICYGIDLWTLFFKQKFIANSGKDLCSRVLKREPLRKKLETEYMIEEAVVVLGMDWTEGDRLKRAKEHQKPYETYFPLLEKPLIDKCEIINYLKIYNIKPPELYKMGFIHNNCNGFCVKAGHTSFIHLLKKQPDVFKYHEEKEQEFRIKFNKDVTISKIMKNGKYYPYSLKEMRIDFENGKEFSKYDWGGCNCFIAENKQFKLNLNN